MSVVWIWLTGLAFAILHSIFATQRSKNIFSRLGMNPKTYRLIYTVIAAALTTLWLGFIHQLPDTALYHIHGWAKGLMMGIQLIALGMVVLSLRVIDTSAFLGFSTNVRGLDAFVEHGIYRHVRHPMYSGVMLALLASPMQTVNSLNLFIVIALYFIMGSKLEERRMLIMHPQYAEYQRRVPAFVPCLRKETPNE